MYFNKLILIGLCLIGFLTSCRQTDNVSPETRSEGEYVITILNRTTGDSTRLVGRDVNTNWDPTTGTIALSNDGSTSGPIGTMSMGIGGVSGDNNENVTVILVRVSKTDVAQGTADQLNARLFESTNLEDRLDSVIIGSNFISAKFNITGLKRVRSSTTQEEETADIYGYFVAIDD